MSRNTLFKFVWVYLLIFLSVIFVIPALAYVSVSTSASIIPYASPDEGGNVTLDQDSPELVVNSLDQSVSAVFSRGTRNPSINLQAVCKDNSAISPAMSITSSNAYNINLVIPENTFFTGNGLIWNCVLAAPTVANISLPETLGATTILSKAVEIGHNGFNLSFDKPVRLLFPSDANKKVGYTISDDSFVEILSICNGDSGVGLSDYEDCKVNVGNDLVVWTRHFTKFATFSLDPIVSDIVNNGDNGSVIAGGGELNNVDIIPILGINPVVVSGGKIVDSPNITLFFYVSNADQMMISEKSTYDGAEWEPYAFSKNFTISGSYGSKALYIKFRSSTGKEVSTKIVINYVSQKTQTPIIAPLTPTSTFASTTSSVPNSTVITVPNATHNTTITDPGIRLFDIILNINQSTLNSSSDLVAQTEFTSFGTVPTDVRLNYVIKDSSGKEVFKDSGVITVETEKLVTKDFKKLNLAIGKYTLFLTTTYGNNVVDEFKQTFEVKKSSNSENKQSMNTLLLLISVLVVVAGGIYVSIKSKKL